MKPAKTSPPVDFPATFVRSLATLEDLPPIHSEGIVGFAGRSNVGKSSLINRLARRNHLARVGRTPGKTTLANLYALDRGGYFLDLPGYGYMKRDKGTALQARNLASELVERLPHLNRILLLVDVRRGILESDWEALLWLETLGRSVTVLLSKADLVSKNQLRSVLEEWKNKLRTEAGETVNPVPLPLSSRTGDGIQDLGRMLLEDLYGPEGI